MRIRVQAQCLQPADRLVNTPNEVLKVVQAGLDIPARQCEIVLADQPYVAHWNKKTKILIDRDGE